VRNLPGRRTRDLPCKRIECDEFWSFWGAKQRNVPAERKAERGIGDVYTYVALDPDSKLAVTWRSGNARTGTPSAS
jgi:hypothetical protein